MALSEFEQKRCERLVGAFIESRRPPAHIRPQLDLGFRVAEQSVEIFEVRPKWRGKPGEGHVCEDGGGLARVLAAPRLEMAPL